jgi:hypothetical protein
MGLQHIGIGILVYNDERWSVTAIKLRVWTYLLLECKACLAGAYKLLRTIARQALHSIRA